MSRKKKAQKASILNVYKSLWPYVRPFCFMLVLSVIGNLGYAGTDALFVYILKPVLDKGFIARDPIFLMWLPVLVILMFLLRGSMNLLGSYATAFVSRGVILELQNKVFNHLQKLPASFYDHNSSGSLLSIMVYNVSQIANVSADALVTFLQSFGMIVGLLVVMFSISWQLSLLYFIALPMIIIVVRYSSKRVRRISVALQESMKDIISTAEENLEGYRVVRAFGGEQYESKKFHHYLEVNRRKELKNVVIKSMTIILVQLVAAFVLAITAFFATSHHAGEILSAGDFTALIAAMLAILKPMKNFTTVNNIIQRGIAAAESVFEVLQLPLEKDTGTIEKARVNGAIEFKNVSFKYEGTDKTVLEDINLTIPKGKLYAFVGRSGAGKSTFVQLLSRFYHDYEGDILVDGVSIRDYRLKNFREQFALVSQNVALFNETIANNISYGDFEKTNLERVKESARLAHASEFIEEMADGYNSMVGENGVRLSGGQRQRLAIARAIYKDAPILILDEATSALDTESERYIQDGLDVLMQNRTTLVIAHRLSTIMKADCIVVFDHGRMIEQGCHDELLEKNGAYAKLYQMQFKDE